MHPHPIQLQQTQKTLLLIKQQAQIACTNMLSGLCRILNYHRVLPLLLLAITVLSPSLQAKTATPYTDKIEETTSAIKALQRTQKKLARNYDASQKKIRQLDKSLAEARQNVSLIEESLAAKRVELTAKREQVAATTLALATERESLKHQIRVAYQQGHPHPLALLLSEQHPSTWEQIAVYHHAFVAAREANFTNLTQLQSRKKEQEQELLLLTQGLEQDQVQAVLAAEQLTKLRSRQELLAKKVARERNAAGTSLSSLRKELENLETLLAAWKSRQTLSQPFAKQRGKLAWPVLGRVQSANKGKHSQRRGVFITAQAGTPVKAVHDGQVIFADWLRGFGLMCIVDHGDGYLSLYGHNETLARKPGDTVQKGDVLGRVGQSGGNDRAGLYFELRHNGSPTDPKKWLARR